MTRISIALLTAACCGLGLDAASAAGAPSAQEATLERLQGRVLTLAPGAKRFADAEAGDRLKPGAEVKTLKDAAAHLTFANGATVLVKERSSFTLGGTAARPFLSFQVGEFLIGLKRKLGKGRSFRVRTPAAVAAVRGTLFWGKSDEKNDSTYACFSDAIAITAQGRTVTLEKGKKVRIPYGKPPDEPEAADIPLSYVDTFAIDGSIQDLGDLLKK